MLQATSRCSAHDNTSGLCTTRNNATCCEPRVHFLPHTTCQRCPRAHGLKNTQAHRFSSFCSATFRCGASSSSCACADSSDSSPPPPALPGVFPPDERGVAAPAAPPPLPPPLPLSPSASQPSPGDEGLGAAWELLALDWWKRQLSFKEIWAQQGRGAKEWWQSEALFAEANPPPPSPFPNPSVYRHPHPVSTTFR
jgi:hypothetical protein